MEEAVYLSSVVQTEKDNKKSQSSFKYVGTEVVIRDQFTSKTDPKYSR